VDPPAWVDPMLEELTTSLVVSQSTGAPAPRCPLARAVASQEVEASPVHTRSLAETA
jgi:hypothetical protein